MSSENVMSKRWLKILCLALSLAMTFLWLGFIFSNSLKTGEESGEQSSKVHEVVNQVAQSLGVKEEISEDTVRSGAHFVEFTPLGFLLCLTVVSVWRLGGGSRLPRLAAWSCLALPLSVAMAGLDEYLQSFSKDRSAELSDVLLDSAGGLTGLLGFLVLLWIVWLIRKRKNRKNV